MRCLVCKSDFTKYYEQLRKKGSTIPKIFNESRKIGETFSEQSLYRHFRNHYDKEGIKVIPEQLAIYVIIPVFKDYVNKSNIKKTMSILTKYLPKPYVETKKELYKSLKKAITDLDDFDINKFNILWEQAINEPLSFKPFSGKSFNEYFKK